MMDPNNNNNTNNTNNNTRGSVSVSPQPKQCLPRYGQLRLAAYLLTSLPNKLVLCPPEA